MSPARTGSLLLLLGVLLLALGSAARADISVPGNAAVTRRPSPLVFPTAWPAAPPCASGPAEVTAIDLGADSTLSWSNDRGDRLRLTGARPTASLPAALRRDPPTHLTISGRDDAYRPTIKMRCRDVELIWNCGLGKSGCQRQVLYRLEPGVSEHYADRPALVARAFSHRDEARNLVIDKVLVMLADACVHQRCSEVATAAAARLRALRAAPPWRHGREVDDMVERASPDGADGLLCHPVGCQLGLGRVGVPGWLALSVDAITSPSWARLQADDWIMIIAPDGVTLIDDVIR
jgi:hypothetical protein